MARRFRDVAPFQLERLGRLDIGPDGTVEMSAEDAEYLSLAGWTKTAEGSREDAALIPL
jgi:hypothetical protein